MGRDLDWEWREEGGRGKMGLDATLRRTRKEEEEETGMPV